MTEESTTVPMRNHRFIPTLQCEYNVTAYDHWNFVEGTAVFMSYSALAVNAKFFLTVLIE
jgi:hypothetical protein